MKHPLLALALLTVPALADAAEPATDLRRIPDLQVRVAGASSAETNGGWTKEFAPPEFAADGDPRTLWHSAYTGATSPLPQWIAFDLGRPRSVAGLEYLPRADGGNGSLMQGQVFVGDAPAPTGAPAAQISLPVYRPGERQTVRFAPRSGRYAVLVVQTAVPPQSVASAAEIGWLTDQPAGIELASPQPNQVVQRGKDNRARVRFAGRVDVPAKRVRIAVAGRPHPAAGPLPAPFDIPVDPATGEFAQEIELPAGGWYTVTVSVRSWWRTIARLVVERVGVGEVFVTAGQSNSTSCGDTRTAPTSGLVSAFSGLRWTEARDPMPGSHDQYTYHGGSLWPSFGDALAARLGVPVGVAVTGHGGTHTRQWQPDARDGLFAWTLERVRQLGTNGFRCVLWHQGESDTDSPDNAAGQQAVYGRMTNIILTLRREAGWDIPWSVAQVSFRPNKGQHAAVRAAHAQLWKDGVALPGPDTDRYLGAMRDQGGRGIHFSPPGLQAVGRDWADRMVEFIGSP